jgi:hypothetical protein
MTNNHTVTLTEVIEKYNHELFKIIPFTSQAFYKTLPRYVAAFLNDECRTSDMPLHEVTDAVLESFGSFLLKRFSARTADRNKRLLQKILRYVGSGGEITGNITLRNYSTQQDYLNKEELMNLLRVALPSLRLRRIRDIFVFSSFTGLRYDDLLEITSEHLSTCTDGYPCLLFVRRMTGRTIRIPLLDIPQRIIIKYMAQYETLLPAMSNAKVNLYLKEIAGLCGIEKRLTISAARNTFAHTVAFSSGLTRETVARIMGDTADEATPEMERDFIALTPKIEDMTVAYVG